MRFLDRLFLFFYNWSKKGIITYSDPENSAITLILIFVSMNLITVGLALSMNDIVSKAIALKRGRDIGIILIVHLMNTIYLYIRYIKDDKYKKLVEQGEWKLNRNNILVYLYLFFSILSLMVMAFVKIP